jgi:hypothetical protein
MLTCQVFEVTLDADSGSRNTNAAAKWNCLVANKAEKVYSDAQMNMLQQKARTFNCGDTRRPKSVVEQLISRWNQMTLRWTPRPTCLAMPAPVMVPEDHHFCTFSSIKLKALSGIKEEPP